MTFSTGYTVLNNEYLNVAVFSDWRTQEVYSTDYRGVTEDDIFYGKVDNGSVSLHYSTTTVEDKMFMFRLNGIREGCRIPAKQG